MVAVAALIVSLTCACSTAAKKGFTPSDEDVSRVPRAPATPASASKPGDAPDPGMEVIIVGPRMRVLIDWPAGLEADRLAMMRAFTDTYTAGWKAVVTGGKDDSYRVSVQDDAILEAGAWVRGFVDVRASARGVARVYALRVPSVTGRGAEVDACVDESGVRLTDAATGRLATEQPSWTRRPEAIRLQIAGVRRGDDDKWRVKAFQHVNYPHEAAKECAR